MFINNYKYQKNRIRSLLKNGSILIIGNINHKNYRLGLKIEQMLKTEMQKNFYRTKNINLINELKLGIFFNISKFINGPICFIQSNSLKNLSKLNRVFKVFCIIINNRVYFPNNLSKIKNYNYYSSVSTFYLNLNNLSKKLNVTLIKLNK